MQSRRAATNKFHGGASLHHPQRCAGREGLLCAGETGAPDNDFSVNIGGAIVKNKLFFFAGEEFKKITRYTNPARVTVPTQAEINGDFSDRTNTKSGIRAHDAGLRTRT